MLHGRDQAEAAVAGDGRSTNRRHNRVQSLPETKWCVADLLRRPLGRSRTEWRCCCASNRPRQRRLQHGRALDQRKSAEAHEAMPHRFVRVLRCFQADAVVVVGRSMNEDLVGGSRRGQGSRHGWLVGRSMNDDLVRGSRRGQGSGHGLVGSTMNDDFVGGWQGSGHGWLVGRTMNDNLVGGSRRG